MPRWEKQISLRCNIIVKYSFMQQIILQQPCLYTLLSWFITDYLLERTGLFLMSAYRNVEGQSSADGEMK